MVSDNALIEAAKKALENAYAPYSGFRVGAALLTKDDRIFNGANVESSSYALSVCAERSALAKAVSEGYRDFERLVIVTDTDKPTSPCGACRQVFFEFNPELKILMVALKDGQKETTLRELLPDPFDLSELKGED